MGFESVKVTVAVGVEGVKREFYRWIRKKGLVGVQVEKKVWGVCDVDVHSAFSGVKFLESLSLASLSA